MSKKVYNLVAKIGGDDEEKPMWQVCGVIIMRDEGLPSIKLNCLPVGDGWNGWLNAYPKKDEAGKNPSPTTEPSTGGMAHACTDEEIPF